jgi:pyranose oxidase
MQNETSQGRVTSEVDVLVVGSGPVGATFARIAAERAPEARILMVDAGPQLTDRPGVHIKNIANTEERVQAQVRSQGPTQFQYELPSFAERANAAAKRGRERIAMLARPGTHLINPDDADLDKSEMPAAAAATNVGGAGSHWTCACPRPGNTERVPFIPNEEWDHACTAAEELLKVTTKAFPESVEGFAIQQTLGEIYDPMLPEGLKVQPMPLAVQVREDGALYWTGPDVVLGPLAEQADDGNGRFELRSETICRRLIVEGDRVTGAEIEHLPSGRREIVKAKFVAVGADSLRTPQLLWASGIRPRALGHYINDHIFNMASVELSERVIERARAALQAAGRLPDSSRAQQESIIGIFRVPFHSPEHPFHAQVMHLDVSPIPLDPSQVRGDPRHIVGLGWVPLKEIRYEDHVEFSDTETDYFGMPKMTIHYALTDKDQAALEAARAEQRRAAEAFGRSLEGDPQMLPPGTSLHYQGSMRMGEHDDGTSVCDSYSQVWSLQNLFIGGNGVIPTATACNPTLTSVALAVRAAEKLANILQGK